MSKHHHRDRSWAPAPEALPDDAQTIDNHTHVASVIPFARAMSHEAQEKGQPEVPVYDVDQLLAQAQSVGIGGIIDCGCELPHLMTAIQMALDHPGNVHAALAIHPNESVLHGHRGVPGPDGLPLKYKPYHDTSFEDALAEVHRLATTYPEQVVAIGETGMDLFRTGEGAKELQREAFRAHIALAKELGLPMQIHDRDSHREVIETLLADGAPERTVFHSYSGDREMAEIAREHGWYLSFSGTVSYKGNGPCDGRNRRAVSDAHAVSWPHQRAVHDSLHLAGHGRYARLAHRGCGARHPRYRPRRIRTVRAGCAAVAARVETMC